MARDIDIIELRSFFKYLHPDTSDEEINIIIVKYLNSIIHK